MRLYELTLDDADEYQRDAFGAVLIASIIVSLVLSIAAIIMSTECLRDRAAKICRKKKVNVTDGSVDHNSKSKDKICQKTKANGTDGGVDGNSKSNNSSTKVTPIANMDN